MNNQFKEPPPPYEPQKAPDWSNTIITNIPQQTYSPGIVVSPNQPVKIVTARPVIVRCPFCGSTVTTRPRAIAGNGTWTACIILALSGLVLGCCLLPFCVDEAKDFQHKCPNCEKVISVYKRLS